MLKPQQQRFCELYAVSKNGTQSYMEAFGCGEESAAVGASRLLSNVKIEEEIARIRKAGEEKAGSAVLTIAEVHDFLARVVRCQVAELPPDSDLFVGIKRHKLRGEEAGEIIEFKIPDKLGAIAKWADLKGEGSQAGAHDAIGDLLREIRK